MDPAGDGVTVAPGDTSVTVRVPAKINLFLSVGPRRDDGFHELTTVYQALSLYDEVTVAAAGRLSVRVEGGEAAGVPLSDDNLAARAVRALAARTGNRVGVAVAITKNIPVAAGMAGGSADAAATLLACDTLWGSDLDREELREIGAELGSDVPFLLGGGTALGSGRGEDVSRVLSRGDYHWVLALADAGLSTPAVYAELDRQRGPGLWQPHLPDGVLVALRNGDPAALGAALHNDLQRAAVGLRPGLRRTLEAGRELGALGTLVSGSGPTVAMLARSDEHSIELAAALAGLDVCRAVRRSHGPVPGARVVEHVR